MRLALLQQTLFRHRVTKAGSGRGMRYAMPRSGHPEVRPVCSSVFLEDARLERENLKSGINVIDRVFQYKPRQRKTDMS
jgi:hypothetical protein